MGFLADKTVFSPLTKEILEESISFSCGNEDLDGFKCQYFHEVLA